MKEQQTTDQIREAVREHYATAVKSVTQGAAASCCGETTCCGGGGINPEQKDFITRDLYNDQQLADVPLPAHLASLGCGNPTALAQLSPGETVLDLGSGGGIDVLLSAKRVGPTGFAYGLDMTDEMLALAEQNKAEAGLDNVKFLKGHIEEIPLPDASVDVIISNCVINLSADKARVLREAFRVLRPGGRFAVSDVVTNGPVFDEMPDHLRRDMQAWTGCISGALSTDDYAKYLRAAGFEDAGFETVRTYSLQDLEDSGFSAAPALTPEQRSALENRVFSAFVRARKP